MKTSVLLLGSFALAACAGGGVPFGEKQQGIATYYDATGNGSCTFGESPGDLDVAALNVVEWQGSALCGACAKVTGPKGTVTVRIVDMCPGCDKGHLDLSREAFAKIGEPLAGRVDIEWELVTCDVAGPIRYRLKDGASQYWTAFQVRNHKVPVKSLEYRKDGAWVPMPRESYNYFIEANGAGPAPLTLRATAITGEALEDTIGDLTPEKEYPGHAQFQ